jgi:hypothetical protein
MLTTGTQCVLKTGFEVVSILAIYLGGSNCAKICKLLRWPAVTSTFTTPNPTELMVSVLTTQS